MAKNDDAEQLRYLYSMYTREYEALGGEISNYMNVGAAFERNIEVLNKVSMVENSKVLLNLEGGTFIETDTKQVKSVMTNVGAGYLVEKNVDDAKVFLDTNYKKIQESVQELMLQRQRMEKEILDLSEKINAAQSK
ncbi:MAG: prefoldin subunit alpha [Candidatus Micrarchaeales archaeon]